MILPICKVTTSRSDKERSERQSLLEITELPFPLHKRHAHRRDGSGV